MYRSFRLAAALALAMSVAACHGVTSPSAYPDDTFSGTLAPGAEADKAFSVGSTGELQMSLTFLSPVPQVGFLWIGIGQYAGGACQLLPGYYTTQAPINQQFAFSTITKGSYCMFVADNNLVLKASTAFTIVTKHP